MLQGICTVRLRQFLPLHRIGAKIVVLGYPCGSQAYMYLQITTVALAVAGTMLLLAGGVYMVMESRLSGEQIADEIRNALSRLQTKA